MKSVENDVAKRKNFLQSSGPVGLDVRGGQGELGPIL